jgi:hypothetical protein
LVGEARAIPANIEIATSSFRIVRMTSPFLSVYACPAAMQQHSGALSPFMKLSSVIIAALSYAGTPHDMKHSL